MKKYTAQTAQKLRDFTDENCAVASFAFSRLLRDRDIRVNGVRTGENILLHAGDEVTYFTTPREESRPFYDVVYEDENVLVCDKYAGVNSEALFSALSGRGARFIHRLDRNTAGVMIFAKNGAAERELLSAFRERRVLKVYEALCFGTFARPHALLAAYLRKDARAALVRVTDAPQAGAEKILTEYEVLRTEGEFTLVRVLLHSGKTHQIRAHLAHVGNPIAGDEKYGDSARNKKYRLRRHILVAKSLSFDAKGVLSYLRGMEFRSRFEAVLPDLSEKK